MQTGPTACAVLVRITPAAYDGEYLTSMPLSSSPCGYAQLWIKRASEIDAIARAAAEVAEVLYPGLSIYPAVTLDRSSTKRKPPGFDEALKMADSAHSRRLIKNVSEIGGELRSMWHNNPIRATDCADRFTSPEAAEIARQWINNAARCGMVITRGEVSA